MESVAQKMAELPLDALDTPFWHPRPKKQDQGSKAPSRDHPNSSFMARLDYIRVEDQKRLYLDWLDYKVLDMIRSIYLMI